MLTKGQRVDLLRKLVGRLAAMELGDMRLVLEEFGLTTRSYEDDTNDSLARRALQSADNDLLQELGDYVFPVSGTQFAAEDESMWTAGMIRVFCSHITADKTFVSAVKNDLRVLGADGFVAHEDIKPNAEWVKTIINALRSCDALVAFLTPAFHRSSWTDQEVGFAVARGIPIVALRMGIDPYGFIGVQQGLTVRDGASSKRIAVGIMEVLARQQHLGRKLASGVVAAFELSDSFATAKKNTAALEQIQKWSPDLLDRVEAALKTNSQIYEAFGVPDRVKALLKKANAGRQ